MEKPSGGYTTPQRAIHWIMALLILPMVAAGFLMVQQGLPRSLQNTLFIFHKNIGVLVLGLAILRLVLRLRHQAPALPSSLPAWQRRIAHASHSLLYVLIFLMPLTGYIRVRAGGFPIEALDRLGLPTLVPRSDTLAQLAKSAHELGAYAIAALLALHIGAALYHALILRDGSFARIWPVKRP